MNPPRPPVKLASAVLETVLERADLAPEAAATAAGAPDAAAALLRIVQAGMMADAARFMAHALPKREAVWWACMCARATVPEAPPADAAIPVPTEPLLHASEPVTVGGRHIRDLIVTLRPGPRVTGRAVFEARASKTAYLRVRPDANAAEAFYGLGEWPDAIEHRGKLRPMQLEVDTSIESSNNENHVPVPLIIGTYGWGMFVKSDRPGVFDVARQSATMVDVGLTA